MRLTVIVLISLVAGTITSAVCAAETWIEGFTHPRRTANVATATSGVVAEVSVDEGQTVAAGDTLGRLDDSVQQALLDSARAAAESRGELLHAEAEFALRSERLAAIEGLHTRGHATKDELRRVRLESEIASVRRRTAQEKARLRDLEVRKLAVQAKGYTVSAPFSGVVVSVEKTTGEYVGPVDPVFCQLADLSELSAKFFVPQDAIRDLKTGDTAVVRFPASDERVEGIALVSPIPNGESGTVEVSVRLDNRDGELGANRRCQLALPSEVAGDASAPSTAGPIAADRTPEA